MELDRFVETMKEEADIVKKMMAGSGMKNWAPMLSVIDDSDKRTVFVVPFEDKDMKYKALGLLGRSARIAHIEVSAILLVAEAWMKRWPAGIDRSELPNSLEELDDKAEAIIISGLNFSENQEERVQYLSVCEIMRDDEGYMIISEPTEPAEAAEGALLEAFALGYGE